MGVPEADDHRRSLPGDTTGGPSQDTELGHGTRQQPLLDQGASHGSPGPALKQRQLGRNSRNLKGNYLCKTPDLTFNQGWVSVGVDHNTAAFAKETIRRWWREMGLPLYPEAAELLVTVDGGGSNSIRSRLWKVGL